MTSINTKFNFLLVFFLLARLSLASVEQNDIVYFNGIRSDFLGPDLVNKIKNNAILFLQIKKIKCITTANYRGYQSTYLIRNNKLFLISIKSACDSKDSINLKVAFPLNYDNGMVLVDWYDGLITVSDSNLLRSNINWRAVYYKEFDLICKKGKLKLKKEFFNYRKVENGISRYKYIDAKKFIYNLIIDNLKLSEKYSGINEKAFDIHLIINIKSRLVLAKESNSLYFLDLENFKKQLKKIGKFDIIYQNRIPIEDHYVYRLKYDLYTKKFFSTDFLE